MNLPLFYKSSREKMLPHALQYAYVGMQAAWPWLLASVCGVAGQV